MTLIMRWMHEVTCIQNIRVSKARPSICRLQPPCQHMDQEVEDGNAFAIPDLWRASTLSCFNQDVVITKDREKEPLSTPLTSTVTAEINLDNVSAPLLDLHLALPSLSSFRYGPLEDPESLEQSSVTSSIDQIELRDIIQEDVWSLLPSFDNNVDHARLKSWETFYNRDFYEPRTIFISEAGPRVFDAALAAHANNTSRETSPSSSARVIQSGPLLTNLLQLGLGRESVLYSYVEEAETFQSRIKGFHMSGYSPESSESLVATFIDCGNKMRYLQAFIDRTQNSKGNCPGLLALAGAFSTVLGDIQAQLVETPKRYQSLLQLQDCFKRPEHLLSTLYDIVQRIANFETEDRLISTVYECVQDSEPTVAWLRPLMLQILARVSGPWLESVDGWMGFKQGPALGQSWTFVNVKDDAHKQEGGKETQDLEDEFKPHSIPNFVTQEDAQVIFETGQGLRLLQTHQPEHPLARPTTVASTRSPSLEWHFSWEDIEKVSVQAKDYENNLRRAITEFSIHGNYDEHYQLQMAGTSLSEIATVGVSGQTAKRYIDASITAFEKPLPGFNDASKGQFAVFLARDTMESDETIQESLFTPPLSLLSVLSFSPLISTQAHLVNQACLRLLFKEYQIRSHFSLLHRYNLFGDGVFVSRLSHALFDPEMQSAERRKGHSRSGKSGLKLGYRDTWPPASSELRLALMGILTDSYFQPKENTSSMFRAEMPGGLSFAIWEMPESELQRCMDPDAVEALDFLRLQYKPPPPLNTVITQDSLLKYDMIFKLLLRAVRILFVVNQLRRDSSMRTAFQNQAKPLHLPFRVESHHFVSVVCNYIFNGVTTSWSILERKLEAIEKALDRQGPSDGDSLHKIRDFHEQVLDRMMFTLLLRKRQAQVMQLLEEIFSLILLFAKHTRAETSEQNGKFDLNELFQRFRRKVKVFISVCRGLSERRGQDGFKGNIRRDEITDDEDLDEHGRNTMGQLLLHLNMSGFYG